MPAWTHRRREQRSHFSILRDILLTVTAMVSATVVAPAIAAGADGNERKGGQGSSTSVAAASVGNGSFPSAGTTGVPDGVALTPSGSLVVTKKGTVIDGLHIKGTVTVQADDVVIKRSLIENTGRYPIKVTKARNLVVEDTGIDGRGTGSAAICCSDYTLRRVDIHHVTEGPRLGSRSTVENSYIHHLVRCKGAARSSCHVDALQTTGGTGMRVTGNNIQAYNPDTGDAHNAVFMFGEETSKVRSCVVHGNLMNGGGFAVNGGGGGTRGAQCDFRDNRLGSDVRHRPVGNLGRGSTWHPSNVWHDTGARATP